MAKPIYFLYYLKTLGVLLLFAALITGCSSEKTDAFLLEKDRKELEADLYTQQVLTYKLGKICIRASIERDTVSPAFRAFKPKLDNIFNKLVKYDLNKPDELSLGDYISIYRDYREMNAFIKTTDEDIFPTVMEALNVAYGDSLGRQTPFITGQAKAGAQSIEHAALSAIVLLSRDMGKEVALYECSKTRPEVLADTEIKSLLQFFRGFLFFDKKLFYLSEHEITQNIDWLNKHPNVQLPMVRGLFHWGTLSDADTYTAFHAFNHLFRGFGRMMMERKIDETRSLEDLQTFLDDSHKLGANNELVWATEAYVYIKHEDQEKAIVALTNLKSSPLLSANDKQNIDQSVAYLHERKPGSALNGVYDKFFLANMASKYMFALLAKVDWERVLRENGVPHTAQLFGTIRMVEQYANHMRHYTSGEAVKETGTEIKEGGKGLLQKAKDVFK